MICKVCKSKINSFLSFGKMPMAKVFLNKKDFKKEFYYKLEGFCKKTIYFK